MQGLVVTGGEQPVLGVEFEDRSHWMVVAADSGLDYVARHGISPDAIVGDMDSVQDVGLFQRYPDAITELYDPAKDRTDSEIGLDFVWERSIADVTLLGGGGGRLDHLLAISAMFERSRYPRRWITHREDVRIIDGDECFETSVRETVSIIPVGDGIIEMESEGLRWSLDGLRWRRGDVGICNEATGETCRIRVKRGRALLIRPLPKRLLLV